MLQYLMYLFFKYSHETSQMMDNCDYLYNSSLNWGATCLSHCWGAWSTSGTGKPLRGGRTQSITEVPSPCYPTWESLGKIAVVTILLCTQVPLAYCWEFGSWVPERPLLEGCPSTRHNEKEEPRLGQKL